MKDVRYYTTKPLSGSIAFKCIFCEHTVTTQEFNSLKGNRRTQAAAVMNQHAAELHLSSRQGPAPAKLGNRGAF
jgi:hypothetical protein